MARYDQKVLSFLRKSREMELVIALVGREFIEGVSHPKEPLAQFLNEQKPVRFIVNLRPNFRLFPV